MRKKTETHLSCGVKNPKTALLEEKFDQPNSTNMQNKLFIYQMSNRYTQTHI